VTARNLFPDECVALDLASGVRFPFSAEQIQAAHARWTAEWLAWEETHDSEYTLKAAEIEATLRVSRDPSLDRARLEAVERQKLERYQRRYEEYVRVGKALQALMI
jgi:DNA-directed RNA polymerase